MATDGALPTSAPSVDGWALFMSRPEGKSGFNHHSEPHTGTVLVAQITSEDEWFESPAANDCGVAHIEELDQLRRNGRSIQILDLRSVLQSLQGHVVEQTRKEVEAAKLTMRYLLVNVATTSSLVASGIGGAGTALAGSEPLGISVALFGSWCVAALMKTSVDVSRHREKDRYQAEVAQEIDGLKADVEELSSAFGIQRREVRFLRMRDKVFRGLAQDVVLGPQSSYDLN